MMADPMGDEAATVLAAHLQQGIEGHGHHDEILLLVPDREDTTIATANNKRTASDAMLEEEVAYDEDDSRKKRKNNPPPKKLNNEQWDAMFARLVRVQTATRCKLNFAFLSRLSMSLFLSSWTAPVCSSHQSSNLHIISSS